MNTPKKPFKQSPKKYHPKGLTILHEDYDIIVVDKHAGLLTIATENGNEKTAHALLKEYVKKGNPRSKNRVFIVHRLDRDTSGVLVFAKSAEAKDYLQETWNSFSKTYYAVVHGTLEEKEGTIQSYLNENKAYRVYSTDSFQGKLAETNYKVIKEGPESSLLEIKLVTGRKHQIRVHLAEKDHPVMGDKFYGLKDKSKRLALHAATLLIKHPFSKKDMTFETPAPKYFGVLLK